VTGREQRMQELLRSFEDRASKATQLRETLKDVRGSGRSPDGAVTVTVAPSGAVLGLQLAPHAMRRTHTALQQEILQVIRQATQHAAAQLEQAVAPLLGDQLGQVRRGLGAGADNAVAPEAPTPPPPADPGYSPIRHQIRRNRTHSADIEGDESSTSFLR
jgi:DNA-binding protein YbaB